MKQYGPGKRSAASGIGLALAETMLSYGASRVVLADVNREVLDRETMRLEKAYSGKTVGLACDVTSEADVEAMIARAAAFGGERIDFLFNNAGAGFAGNFDKETNEDWAKAFALNFYGALYGIRAVLPVMRRQGSGHIVNTISGIVLVPMPLQTMYSATKAALNGLSLALCSELWEENIKVNFGHSRYRRAEGRTAVDLRADAAAVRQRHCGGVARPLSNAKSRRKQPTDCRRPTISTLTCGNVGASSAPGNRPGFQGLARRRKHRSPSRWPAHEAAPPNGPCRSAA